MVYSALLPYTGCRQQALEYGGRIVSGGEVTKLGIWPRFRRLFHEFDSQAMRPRSISRSIDYSGALLTLENVFTISALRMKSGKIRSIHLAASKGKEQHSQHG